jgi:cyclopropane-fatty-acyl-phospholipid synthase
MRQQNSLRGQHLVDAGRLISAWEKLSSALFARGFDHMVRRIDAGLMHGMIEGKLPDGSVRVVGGRGPGPFAQVRMNSWMPLARLWASGSVGWYEAWAKGEWDSPDPVQVFDLFMRNRTTLGDTARAHGVSKWINRFVHALRRNSREGARRNIMAHYDLGNDFYRAWLDPGMTYSSAFFEAGDTLEEAQTRKIRMLLDRLDLKPGDHLLEIGCGWGGLAEIAARDYGARVTGLTLSPAQLDYANAQIAAAGLSDRVQFALRDYRDETGTYDAVASVEMVEAVGEIYWPEFLGKVASSLKPGGRAALQYISIADDVFESYARSADFIQTFIFPGGMLLSESRFSKLAHLQGLSWEGRCGFGPCYADTLKLWRERFDHAAQSNSLPEGFDDRFIALWRYYLMYCEGGFRGGGIDVAQVTMVKQEGMA